MQLFPLSPLSLTTSHPGPGGLTTDQLLGGFGVEAGTGRIGIPMLVDSGALDPQSPIYVTQKTKPTLDRLAVLIHGDARRILREKKPVNQNATWQGNWKIFYDRYTDPKGAFSLRLSKKDGPEICFYFAADGRTINGLSLFFYTSDFLFDFYNTFTDSGRTHVAELKITSELDIVGIRELLGMPPNCRTYQIGMNLATKLFHSGFLPQDPTLLRINLKYDQDIEEGQQRIREMIGSAAGEGQYHALRTWGFDIAPVLDGTALSLPTTDKHRLQSLPDCGIQITHKYDPENNSSIYLHADNFHSCVRIVFPT